MAYYQEITLVPQTEITPNFILCRLYTQLHLALVEMQDHPGKVPIGFSFPEYRYETRGCEFVSLLPPPTKETIETLPINLMGAYVLSGDKFYFIHKANREFTQIILNNSQLARFNIKFKLNEIKLGDIKRLLKTQIDEIRLITGHTPSEKSLGTKVRIFGNDETILEQFNLSKWLMRLSDYVHFTSIRPVPAKVLGYARYHRQHLKGSKEKLARRYAKRHGITAEEATKNYENKVYRSNLPYVQLKSLANQQSFKLLIAKTYSTEWIQQGFGTYGLSSFSTVPEF